MKNLIDKNNRSPAYIQLYAGVRDDIVKGTYKYNTKLPSKRIVAAELGVSTVTVEHAYSLLCEEGYVESRERSGYYVIFRESDGFEASVNVNRMQVTQPVRAQHSVDFPFSVLAKTMRSVISDYGESILERSQGSGCDELKKAIADYLARSRGIYCDSSQIIIGSGSEHLYRLIVELLGHDRLYALESPSYNKIEQVYNASTARCEFLPLGPDGIRSSALKKSKADVLHITPYRSFPSGVTASASKRHEYLRWASKKGRYIVEDDFESEFTLLKKNEETLFGSTNSDNVIYMNTFSKTVSASFRVAYIVLPPSLVPVFLQKLSFYSGTVPTYIQLVMARLISNGDFERHINRVRRQKRKESAVDNCTDV